LERIMATPTKAQRRKSLVVVGTLLVFGALGIGTVIGKNRSYLSGQEPFVRGLEVAKKDPEVVSRLGEPIEHSYWFRGRIMLNDQKVQAGYAIPLEGPKGKATLHIGAVHAAAGWRYEHFDLEVGPDKDSPRVLLTAPAPAGVAAPPTAD